MGLFWRRKKDEFVSLRLNEPAEAQPETPAPPAVEPPTETVREEPARPRSTLSNSILGLDRSIEELQAQEAALEQELSARFRRAVAATRDSLSERLDTVRRGIARKQINDLDALKAAIKTELLNILQASERQGVASELSVPEGVSPYVMMIVGVNGV